MPGKTRVILSLDQSTTATGWSVFVSNKLEDIGIFSPTGNREERIYKTCQWLYDKVMELQKHEVVVIIEDIQMQGNVETYKSLAQLQGSIITLLLDLEKNAKISQYKIYYASEWKATCGIKGRRRKEQKKSAQQFVLKRHGIEAPEDICDSICLGEHYLHEQNSVLNFE